MANPHPPYAAELVPRAAEITREVTDAIHNRVPEVGGNPALASATLTSAVRRRPIRPGRERRDRRRELRGVRALAPRDRHRSLRGNEEGRYRFPYGDFAKVNRAALIHAKQRASQNGHDAIEKAADDVLRHLDRRRDG